jgi:hypothetical protein
MVKLKMRRVSPIELAIIASIWGGLALLLWPIVRDSMGPTGEPIPSEPPDEANRIHHPAGFSMVVPPRWSTHVSPALDVFPASLMMAPMSPGRRARRSKALIVVTSLGAGPGSASGLEGYQKVNFSGLEAHEMMAVTRQWTLDDGAWSEYDLYLRHGGNWYHVTYGLAAERTTLPPMIRRYIGTLRWDD